MSIINKANLNLFSHSHRHVYDHSVASCGAILQAPTSFTPDATTVPAGFVVGAAVGRLLLLSLFLAIATAAINSYTSIS